MGESPWKFESSRPHQLFETYGIAACLGEAWAAPGLKIGYLAQEPHLDENKTARENVDEGVSETRALLARFEEVSMKLGEDMRDAQMEKLLAEQGRLQDQIEAENAWELDHTVEMAMDALRCAVRPVIPTSK